MRRESFKTHAYILHCLNYSESDLIVTFFSNEFGKLNGIAKGAKRSKKRFANVFEPFTLTQIIFSRRKSDTLVFIDACDMMDPYAAIRADLEKTLIASYFADLVNHFSPEGKTNPKIFALLQNFLILLCREKATDATLRFFEMRLLKFAGFEPVLDRCVVCKAPLANGAVYYFHPREGGIKCSSCARPERFDQPVFAGTARTLLLSKELEMDKIKQVMLSDALAEQSREILVGFITHILGREIKSLRVMEQVRKLGLP